MTVETLIVELCAEWAARLDVDHAQRPPVVVASVISLAEADEIETRPEAIATVDVAPSSANVAPAIDAETVQPEAVAVAVIDTETAQPATVAVGCVVDRRRLIAALKQLSETVATGRLAKIKPILGGCVVSFDGQTLALSTTDREAEAVAFVDSESEAVAFACVVDFKTLRAAVSACKGATVTIDGRRLAGVALNVGLSTIPKIGTVDDFPTIGVDGFKQYATAMLVAETLADCLRATVGACDSDSTRYALAGVLLELGAGGVVRAVATDGRRLHVCETIDAPTGETQTAIIPADAVAALIESVGALGSGGAVCVEFYRYRKADDTLDTRARFVLFSSSNQSGELLTNCLDGRYPRWQECFTSAPETMAETNPAQLLELFSSAARVLKLAPDSLSVELSATGGRFQVGTVAGCAVSFVDSINAATPGNSRDPLCVNCDYMREIVAAGGRIGQTLTISHAGAMCHVATNGRRVSFRGVVMGVTVKN